MSTSQAVDPPEADPERARTKINQDDLLATIVGANTGDVCRVDRNLRDHYVCQSVALLRPVMASASRFIEIYLNSSLDGRQTLARVAYGAGRPHLSFDQLRAVAVPIPPACEQTEIVAACEADISNATSDIGIDGVAETIATLRQSILHAAFTGRLVPQDPEDEPASALLARLRATADPRRRTRAPRRAAVRI